MKKILLLGYSYIAQKAVIPALEGHKKVRLVAIASQSRFTQVPQHYQSFKNYKEAIDATDCDTVYISLANSLHTEWIVYALERGKHVICDKPVALNHYDTQKVTDAAGSKKVIFEAIAYRYHAQHTTLTKLVQKQTSQVKKIVIQFGFPMLAKDNFRNNKNLGGGCISDIGPYLASVGQLYFGKRAQEIYANTFFEKGLATTSSIIMQFGPNQILQASVGFGLEYKNRLELWGEDFNFTLDRAFSIPKDFKNTLVYKSRDKEKNISIPASDSFANLFTAYANLEPAEYKRVNRQLTDRLLMLDGLFASSNDRQVIKIQYN